MLCSELLVQIVRTTKTTNKPRLSQSFCLFTYNVISFSSISSLGDQLADLSERVERSYERSVLLVCSSERSGRGVPNAPLSPLVMAESITFFYFASTAMYSRASGPGSDQISSWYFPSLHVTYSIRTFTAHQVSLIIMKIKWITSI